MKCKLINRITNEKTLCDKVVVDGFDCYVSDEKIIATNNPNSYLPKVVDEVEEIAKEVAEIEGKYNLDRVRAKINFLLGYKKSQETHPFSEDDVADYLDFIEDNYHYHSDAWHNKDTDEHIRRTKLLQLWKDQQIKTVYYE